MYKHPDEYKNKCNVDKNDVEKKRKIEEEEKSYLVPKKKLGIRNPLLKLYKIKTKCGITTIKEQEKLPK